MMTQKELFYNRLAGRPVDKIPNLNIVMLFAAKYAGVKYGQFCSDYRYLAEAQEKTAEDFGIDILSTMSDPFRETSDYGASVVFAKDNLPICKNAFLTGPEDFSKIKIWEPLESTRILDRIRAIEMFKRDMGEKYPILGWVEGPLAEFMDLTTVSDGMMMLLDEPEAVTEVMERITEQAILCAKAQIEAGADVIGIGDAVASLIGAGTYREQVQPLEMKLIDSIHSMGAKTKLHICGNINHLLSDIIDTGSDIVDIDHMVDFEKAIALSAGKCSISGHINPVKVLFQGTPEDVKIWTKYCVEKGSNTNFISGGCEVPKMTPLENLRAVDGQLREMAR